MQRTKSLAMGVVGPRHQLGKTSGVVAVFPQHPTGQPVSHMFQWHSRTLIPGMGPAPSPGLLRAAEAAGAAVAARSACRAPGAPGTGLRQGQRNHRGERAHGLGLSSRECTHLSRGSSGLQPGLYLLQTNQFALKTLLLEQL